MARVVCLPTTSQSLLVAPLMGIDYCALLVTVNQFWRKPPEWVMVVVVVVVVVDHGCHTIHLPRKQRKTRI